MAKHLSAIKAARQAQRHRVANKKVDSTLKSALKNVRAAKTKTDGETLLKATTKLLDRLAAKGNIHKNKAANQKSKLSKFVKSLA